MTIPAHTVALIPGFLGFGHLGHSYYFVDQCAAALRTALETRCEGPVQCVALGTDPTGRLVDRQRLLLNALQTLDAQLGGAECYHLVGHSTGGLDAILLLAEKPLGGGRWAHLDPANVRPRVTSVTTLSTPIYGTPLATSAVAGLLHHRGFRAETATELTQLLVALTEWVLARHRLADAFLSAIAARAAAIRFVWRLLTHHALVAELQPPRMAQVWEEHPPVLLAPITHFVSVTPQASVTHARGGQRPADPFFRTLQELTAQYETGEGCVAASLTAMGDPQVPHIGRPHLSGAALDPHSNDGVVTTARQMFVGIPTARLGGIVWGDHADVIGYYDQINPANPGKLWRAGCFRSGSGFDDDAFFALYEAVAASILRAVEVSRIGKQSANAVR